jgi:hypothetical protein
VNRVPEGAPPDEIKRFMRGALRETFTARWPLRDYRAGKINPKDE